MTVRELCPELKEKAAKELFETPERIKNDLEAIKEWLKKQPHIKARTDDQWLVTFLRGCKYSLERTKEKLDYFYTMKTAIPEIAGCTTTKDPDMQELLRLGVILPLLTTEKPDDPRVILGRPGLFEASRIKVTTMMRLGQMLWHLMMRDDDQAMIAGQVMIIDMKGVGISLLTQMTPSLAKKAVISRQESMPIREKGTHHINAPSAAEAIFGLIKSFMSEKNKSRLYVYSGGIEALEGHFSKAILPNEYGGSAGPIKDLVDYWKRRMEENEQFFLEDSEYKTDESKRLGTPKTSESLFGIEGSFRQLSID